MSTTLKNKLDSVILNVVIFGGIALVAALVMFMALDSLVPNTRLIGTVTYVDGDDYNCIINCGTEKLVYHEALFMPNRFGKGDVVEVVLHRGMGYKKPCGDEKIVSVERMCRESNYNILAECEGKPILR